MELQEIKDAVEAGKTVRWANPLYKVIKDTVGQWLVVCKSTGGCWGLTWRDDVTMNGKEEDFYIEDDTRITG